MCWSIRRSYLMSTDLALSGNDHCVAYNQSLFDKHNPLMQCFLNAHNFHNWWQDRITWFLQVMQSNIGMRIAQRPPSSSTTHASPLSKPCQLRRLFVINYVITALLSRCKVHWGCHCVYVPAFNALPTSKPAHVTGGQTGPEVVMCGECLQHGVIAFHHCCC